MIIPICNYDELWHKSGVLFKKIVDGIFPKHVLPNESDDYTNRQERLDTNRYNTFCRSKYFLQLMRIGDDD